jgi:hypothetical protein
MKQNGNSIILNNNELKSVSNVYNLLTTHGYPATSIEWIIEANKAKYKKYPVKYLTCILCIV